MTTTINGQNTQTVSAANYGAPNGSSGTTQTWTICPVCGQSYKQGESHVCTFSSASATSQDYWTCSACGQRVRYGELHVCGGRGDSEMWPPQPNWPIDGWPYDSNVTTPNSSLEERRVRARERIAAALKKLAK